MKKNLFLAACLSVASVAGFAQDQLRDGSFEQWSDVTCGPNAYTEPTNWTPFIGPCSSFSMGGPTTYNLDLHTIKVAGEASGTSALKLINTAGSGTNVNTTTLLNMIDQRFDTLVAIPTSIAITYKCDLKGDDTASVAIYLYKGDGTKGDFFSIGGSSMTHLVKLVLSKNQNIATYKTVNIDLNETGITLTPDKVAIIINTGSNEANDYVSDVNSSITIDDIKFKYEAPTTTIIPGTSFELFDKELSPGSIVVNSDVAWTATSSASWLRLNKNTGDAGNNNVTFTVASNTGMERTATITLKGAGAKSKTIYITQTTGNTGAELGIIEPEYPFEPKDATDVTLSILTSSAWKATTKATWFTLSSSTGTGNADITISANDNTGLERNDTIFITAQDVDTQKVVISQYAAAALAELTPEKTTINLVSGTSNGVKLNFTSNSSWMTSVMNSWISVDKVFGEGDGTITISAMANTGAARTGTVYLNIPGVVRNEITVNQAAYTPTSLSGSAISDSVLYPNPTTGTFIVKNATSGTAFVYSMTGQLLVSKSFSNSEAIDVTNLATGLYLVRIVTESGATAQILSKE